MKLLGQLTEAIRIMFRGVNRTVIIDPDVGTPAAGDVTLTVKGDAGAYSDEITTNAAAQTLTNKTLTTPNLNEAVALTSTATDLNKMAGNAVSASDLTKLSEITATSAEINYLDNDDLTSADVQKLADVTRTAADINDLATVTGAETLTNKTLTSPVINGGTTDTTATTVDSVDATKQMALDVSGITTATTRTLTMPDYDVTLNNTGAAAHQIVTTHAELVSALATGGTIGIGANITAAAIYTVAVAGTEIYATDRKFVLTGVTGTPSVFDVTASECKIRDLEITTIDDTQQGINSNTTDKGQYSDLTITMPATATASAIYIDGSYNRVTNLLADSSGGAITGVELAGASSDNLVSGVIVT